MLNKEEKRVKVKEEKEKEETENKNGEEVIDEGLPIDRGWAWVVMIASLINATLLSGYGKTLGLLFVEFVELFKAPATLTTLSFGVMAASMSLSSFVTMNVILAKTTVRKVVLVGITLSSGGLLATSFAKSVPSLICTQMLVGFGRAIIDSPALVLVGRYFRKRRAFATAVAKTGVSLGSLTFPYLVRYLLETYALSGTLMIMSGIQIQMFVFAMLLVEPEHFLPKQKKDLKPGVQKEIQLQRMNNAKDQIVKIDLVRSISVDQKESNGIVNVNVLRSPPTRRLRTESDGAKYAVYKRQRSKAESESSFVDNLSKSGILRYMSNTDLISISTADITSAADITSLKNYQKKDSVSKKRSSCLSKLAGLFDFSLLRNLKFLLLMVVSTFAITQFIGSVYLPALVIENGGDDSDTALFLTIAGVTDVCTRLCIGYIGDLGIVKRHYLMMIGLLIGGLNCQFTKYYTSFWLQVMFSVLYGMSLGPFACLQPVILADYLGLENLAKAIGFTFLVHGASISCYHVVVGAIRDISGSYTLSFNFMGVMSLIAFVLIMLLPLAERLEDNKQAKRASENNNEEAEPLSR